jgi:hypothetical protein
MTSFLSNLSFGLDKDKIYGFRFMVYYWAGLKFPLVDSTLSPQMRRKVLRNLSASMF